MTCDVNFADVALLVHMDGTNGSTSFPDDGPSGLTVTPTNVTVDTASPEFGTGAALFNIGQNRLLIPSPNGSPMDLTQQSDFTVEGWFKIPAYPTTQGLMLLWSTLGSSIANTTWMRCYVGVLGQITFQLTGTAGGIATSPQSTTASITVNTWTHVACVRSGGTFYIFVGGQLLGGNATETGTNTGSMGAVRDTQFAVGWDANAPVQNIYLIGQADEFRVTANFARYTANFTPAGPFGGTCVVTVPNVVAEVLATAESNITAALLAVGTVTTANDPVIPAGSVVSQSPIGGASAMQGDSVDLVNSLGPVPIAVPNVVGQTLADAEAILTTVGFVTGTVTTGTSGSIPIGSIISQSPTAGTFEAPGTSVDLVESEGPVTLLVPDLTNLSLLIATELLNSLGLVLGSVTYISDVLIIAGNVDGQSIAAGTVVSPGTSVNVTVSTGREGVVVPDLEGLTEAEAIAAIVSVGLLVNIISTAPSSLVESGLVMAQNPTAGLVVASGSFVGFVVSSGPFAAGELFDFEATVISQYANSPTLLQLIANMNAYIDQTANFAAFYNFVWNVDTAQGFGLDIWGKIVNVSRLLQIPTTASYFGFQNSSNPVWDEQPFSADGTFFTGQDATQSYLLDDVAYRTLILTKAFSNIVNTTAPALNQLLQNLFPGRGQPYVQNNFAMQMTYVFDFDLTPVELAILQQSGAVPSPVGVGVSISVP
jgi:beta-lactam-binding protein with PASTA domain